MPKAYTELYYHLVWATWRRDPIIRPETQDDLYAYIAHKCGAQGYGLCAVNGTDDHIHVVLQIGPTEAVADAVARLKGSSSHFCNQALDLESPFRWQAGYAALTFGKRDLADVVSYVQNQKRRHQQASIDRSMEPQTDE